MHAIIHKQDPTSVVGTGPLPTWQSNIFPKYFANKIIIYHC